MLPVTGEKLIAYATDWAASAYAPANDRTYCISLVSMVGSLGGSNYIPLFEMTSAPLTLNIQLINTMFNTFTKLYIISFIIPVIKTAL